MGTQVGMVGSKDTGNTPDPSQAGGAPWIQTIEAALGGWGAIFQEEGSS